jgi:hypothetical protein
MLRLNENNTISYGIEPHVGGGQEFASQLYAGFNVLENPANYFDSVQLPEAVVGRVVIVFVNGQQTVPFSLFAKFGTSDVINQATEPSVSNGWAFYFPYSGLNYNQILICTCSIDGRWICNAPAD